MRRKKKIAQGPHSVSVRIIKKTPGEKYYQLVKKYEDTLTYKEIKELGKSILNMGCGGFIRWY